MRLDVGSTDIPTAGSAVRILNEPTNIVLIQVQARPGNTANVYVGMSDVSATHGWTLAPKDQTIIDFDPQGKGTSIQVDELWADTDTNGNDIDWILIFK